MARFSDQIDVDEAEVARVASLMVRFFGEPFRSEMTRATAAERLSLAGLRVVEDTGSAEWRRLYANPQANISDVIRERIAVAEL